MGPARSLILTRPLAQTQDWLQRLAGLGVAAQSFPLIEIASRDGAAAEAAAAWLRLPTAALAFFVSPNAVQHFFAQRPAAQAWPAACLAACVGPGSARALQAAGVPAELILQPPADAASLDSEHLWPLLQPRDWQGRQVLLLRGDGGREWLAERLRERGADVTAFSVYSRRCPELDAAGQARLRALLAAPQASVWLLSSAEGVANLAALAAGDAAWGQRACIATHARIAEAARALGFGHVVLARPDAPALVQAFQAMQG
ncbi:uroporphyrinogen-III synthase [Paucibacter oligotrophus]|uniref:Uroporphyrinogen-III synthase n=1 Tax=Roseateles oligotrophus TaxID=1769250 RepID=A0A840LAD8_9BURK|nr:uroporphyrinogen-III synthase [Roseateles oligotrophus]MBB4843735.1 uroporphyrinogen-III synthase [Roseateles oligotrophus]